MTGIIIRIRTKWPALVILNRVIYVQCLVYALIQDVVLVMYEVLV